MNAEWNKKNEKIYSCMNSNNNQQKHQRLYGKTIHSHCVLNLYREQSCIREHGLLKVTSHMMMMMLFASFVSLHIISTPSSHSLRIYRSHVWWQWILQVTPTQIHAKWVRDVVLSAAAFRRIFFLKTLFITCAPHYSRFLVFFFAENALKTEIERRRQPHGNSSIYQLKQLQVLHPTISKRADHTTCYWITNEAYFIFFFSFCCFSISVGGFQWFFFHTWKLRLFFFRRGKHLKKGVWFAWKECLLPTNECFINTFGAIKLWNWLDQKIRRPFFRDVDYPR